MGAALHARPADRCEPWRSEDPSLITRIACAARTAELDTNLAAVLVVERMLIEAEFELLAEELGVGRLDAQAERAQVTMELGPVTADYLRALNPRGTRASATPATFRLPMRLTDRILRVGLRHLLRPEVLRSAISWERAAVLSGQTMSEWVLTVEDAAR